MPRRALTVLLLAVLSAPVAMGHHFDLPDGPGPQVEGGGQGPGAVAILMDVRESGGSLYATGEIHARWTSQPRAFGIMVFDEDGETLLSYVDRYDNNEGEKVTIVALPEGEMQIRTTAGEDPEGAFDAFTGIQLQFAQPARLTLLMFMGGGVESWNYEGIVSPNGELSARTTERVFAYRAEDMHVAAVAAQAGGPLDVTRARAQVGTLTIDVEEGFAGSFVSFQTSVDVKRVTHPDGTQTRCAGPDMLLTANPPCDVVSAEAGSYTFEAVGAGARAFFDGDLLLAGVDLDLFG